MMMTKLSVKSFFLICFLLTFLSCSSSSVNTLTKEIKSSQLAFKSNKILTNIWSKNFDGDYQSGNLPISSAGAYVDKDFVFAADQNGKFYSFNKLTGRVVWSKQSKGSMISSPVVDEHYVYYGTSLGRFYSRKKNTGKLNYEVDLGAGIVTTPTFYKGRAFVHLNNHKIICLDQSTGKILWAYTRSIPFITTIQGASEPLIYKGKLYIGFSDGFMTSFRIEDGVLLWEKKIGLNNKFIDLDAKPQVFENNLYVFAQDEELNVINLNNGDLLKKFNIFPTSISLTKNKKNLLVGSRKGELFVVKGSVILKKKLLSKFAINKIISWGAGYFLSDLGGYVYYLDSNYNIKWKKLLGHSYSTVLGKVNHDKNILAIYTSRQKMYVYRLN